MTDPSPTPAQPGAHMISVLGDDVYRCECGAVFRTSREAADHSWKYAKAPTPAEPQPFTELEVQAGIRWLENYVAELREEANAFEDDESARDYRDDAAAHDRVRRMLSSLLEDQKRQQQALRLAATRMEILTGRMRACHQETGRHELIDEAEMFAFEARAAARTPLQDRTDG